MANETTNGQSILGSIVGNSNRPSFTSSSIGMSSNGGITAGLLPKLSNTTSSYASNNVNSGNSGISSFGSNDVTGSKFNRQEYAETFGKGFSDVNGSVSNMSQNVTAALEQNRQVLTKGFSAVVESINKLHETVQKLAEERLSFEQQFENNATKRLEEYEKALEAGVSSVVIGKFTNLWGEIWQKPDIEGLKKTFTSYLFENFKVFGNFFGVNTSGNTIDIREKPVAFTLETRDTILKSKEFLEQIEYNTNKLNTLFSSSLELNKESMEAIKVNKEESLAATIDFRNRLILNFEKTNLNLNVITERLNNIGASIVIKNEQDFKRYETDLNSHIININSMINNANITKDRKSALEKQRSLYQSNLSYLNSVIKSKKKSSDQDGDKKDNDLQLTGVLAKVRSTFINGKGVNNNIEELKNYKLENSLKKLSLKSMDKLTEVLKKNVDSIKQLDLTYKKTREQEEKLAEKRYTSSENPSTLKNVIDKLYSIISEPLNIFRGLGSAVTFFAKWGAIYKAADWAVGLGRKGINYISDIGLGQSSDGTKRTVGTVAQSAWSGLTSFVDPLITGIRNVFKDFIGEETFERISNILSSTKEWVGNLWTGLFGPEAERYAAREKLFEPLKKSITYITEKLILPALYRGYVLYNGTRALLNPIETFDKIRSFGNANKLEMYDLKRAGNRLATTLKLQGIKRKDFAGFTSDAKGAAKFARSYNIEDPRIAGYALANLNRSNGVLSGISRAAKLPFTLFGKAMNFIPVIGQVIALGQTFAWLYQGIKKFKSWWEQGNSEGFSGFIKENVSKFFSTSIDMAKELFPIAIKAVWEGTKGVFRAFYDFVLDEGGSILSAIYNGFTGIISKIVDYFTGKTSEADKEGTGTKEVSTKDKVLGWGKTALGAAASLGGAKAGALLGAKLGSVMPGWGTAIGALIGAGIGYAGTQLVESGVTQATGNETYGKMAGSVAGVGAIATNVNQLGSLYKAGKTAQGVAKAKDALNTAKALNNAKKIKTATETLNIARSANNVAQVAARHGSGLLPSLTTLAVGGTGLYGARLAYQSYKDDQEREKLEKDNPWLKLEQGALISSLGQDLMRNNIDYAKFKQNSELYKKELEEIRDIAKIKRYPKHLIKNVNLALSQIDNMDVSQFNQLKQHFLEGKFKINESTARQWDVEGKPLLDAVKTIRDAIMKDIKNKKDKEDKEKADKLKEQQDKLKEQQDKEIAGGVSSLGQLSQWIQNGTAKRWIGEQITKLGDSIKGAWNFLKNQDYKKMFGSAMEVFGGVSGNIMSAIFGEEKAEKWLTAAMKYTDSTNVKRFLSGARSSILSNVANIADYAAKTNRSVEDIQKLLREDWDRNGVPEENRKMPGGNTNYDSGVSQGLYNYVPVNEKSNQFTKALGEKTVKNYQQLAQKNSGVQVFDENGKIDITKLDTADKQLSYGFALTRLGEGDGVNKKEQFWGSADKTRKFHSRNGIYAAALGKYANESGYNMPKELRDQVQKVVGKSTKTDYTWDSKEVQGLNEILGKQENLQFINQLAKNVYEKDYYNHVKNWPIPVRYILADTRYQHGNDNFLVNYTAKVLGYNKSIDNVHKLNSDARRFVFDKATKSPWDVASVMNSVRLTATEYGGRVQKIAAGLGFTQNERVFSHEKNTGIEGFSNLNWMNQATKYNLGSINALTAEALRHNSIVTSYGAIRNKKGNLERKANTLRKDEYGKWSGTSMDCSQYVGTVLNNLGFNKFMNRGNVFTSSQMLAYFRDSRNGFIPKFNASELAPGDVLFNVKTSKNVGQARERKDRRINDAVHVALLIPGRNGGLEVSEATGNGDTGEGGIRQVSLDKWLKRSESKGYKLEAYSMYGLNSYLPNNPSALTPEQLQQQMPQQNVVNKLPFDQKYFASRYSDTGMNFGTMKRFYRNADQKEFSKLAVRLKNDGFTAQEVERLLSTDNLNKEDLIKLDKFDKIIESLIDISDNIGNKEDRAAVLSELQQISNRNQTIIFNSSQGKQRATSQARLRSAMAKR